VEQAHDGSPPGTGVGTACTGYCAGRVHARRCCRVGAIHGAFPCHSPASRRTRRL